MSTKHDTALRTLRRARTLTQEHMARVLGVTQKTYSEYESGKLTPSVPTKARIAAILGVAVGDLWPTDCEVAK